MRHPLLVVPIAVALGCGGGSSSQDGRPGGGGPPGGGRGGPPPLPVQVAEVEESEIVGSLSAVGSLQSPETTVVAADISGLVLELDTPEGRLVQRGHVLARLDDSVPQAALKVARAREKNARADLDRIAPLFEDGVVPRANYDAAVHELETAQGLLQEAETRLGKTEVRAPFTGVLSLRTAQLGQYVSSGDAIVQITKIDPLELVFTVPEEDASRIRPGQQIEGRVGRCGATFAGTVEALDPMVDPESRTLSVQARVPNRGGSLRPGMSAQLRVLVGTGRRALLVPQEALIRQGTRYLVYVVAADDTVEPRDVAPGDFLLQRVEIVRGVEPGERVIVAGHQKTRPGATVQPVPWQPVENPLLALGEGPSDCP
ncbi:MAG: efflux RND transporter periplasmic adaptor subunit [Thermoanaerobaculia bacterium]|nr:efflux RND transporter periplasmic adaptor subunit [Thermoanaerobaculia bacterium]